MLLKRLLIERQEAWADAAMPLCGKAEFVSPNGKLEIALNEETAKKILEVVAEQLVETSREVARNMTAELLQQVPALENKE